MSQTIFKFIAAMGIVAVVILYGLELARIGKSSDFRAIDTVIAAIIGIQSTFIPSSQITLSTSVENPVSGSPFKLEWNHTGKKAEGSYVFSYDCVNDFYFLAEVPSPRDGIMENQIVFCNTPFNFLNSDNSLSLVPVIETGEGKNVSMSIGFMPNGKDSFQKIGITERFISPRAVDSNTNNKENEIIKKTPQEVSPAAEIPQSVPRVEKTSVAEAGVDLAVSIKGIGILNATTNEFRPSEKIKVTDVGAVFFEVVNRGAATSPSWTFQVSLPTYPVFVFESEIQQPLGTGDRIEYTLGFDQINPYINEWPITVSIDPKNTITETSRKNNTVKVLAPVSRL